MVNRQLIARRACELGVLAEIRSFDISEKDLGAHQSNALDLALAIRYAPSLQDCSLYNSNRKWRETSMNLEQKITLTAEARIKELELRWTMTQLFFFIHSGLFSVVLFQSSESAFKEVTLFRIAVCMLGLLLAIVWRIATRRSQQLLAYWNERLAVLESEQEDKITVFVTPEGGVPSPPGVTMDSLLLGLVALFILAWCGLLLHAIVQLYV